MNRWVDNRIENWLNEKDYRGSFSADDVRGINFFLDLSKFVLSRLS